MAFWGTKLGKRFQTGGHFVTISDDKKTYQLIFSSSLNHTKYDNGQRRPDGAPRLTERRPNPLVSILYIYMMAVWTSGLYALQVIYAVVVLRGADGDDARDARAAIRVDDVGLGEYVRL